MKEDRKLNYGNCGGNPHKEGNPRSDSRAMIRIGVCQLIVTSASFFAQLLAMGK